MQLYQCKGSTKCIIKKLPKACILQSLGICEGLNISVYSKAPFGGPVLIQAGRRKVALGKEVANNIMVEVV
ncbi:FeoA family protein [Evansella cellulosilytica]|uniref:FeoA family protein n=1 Tax=Evansella cellulosilytica (strain ATCC 21833 / DSM 2522 / FERM P-1141 / JCM 9156 / N-4) TaxID=649639 RepID=E6TW89_EVAC2|nr:FeoA family protein [Evansella cellulosilytica]ADU31045.1 FeoA family protein [Evansella cellulosilytica DSM 2522]